MATGWPQQFEALPAEQAAIWVNGPNWLVILPKLIPQMASRYAWRLMSSVERGMCITRLHRSPPRWRSAPGRFLNLTSGVRPFCRVAKHPELLNWLQRLLGHPAQAPAVHRVTQGQGAEPRTRTKLTR